MDVLESRKESSSDKHSLSCGQFLVNCKVHMHGWKNECLSKMKKALKENGNLPDLWSHSTRPALMTIYVFLILTLPFLNFPPNFEHYFSVGAGRMAQ